MREKIASEMHEIWIHWMKYLFARCNRNEQSRLVIPFDCEVRWKNQMGTLYDDLSESEKESDRHQADKIIAILSNNGLQTDAQKRRDLTRKLGRLEE